MDNKKVAPQQQQHRQHPNAHSSLLNLINQELITLSLDNFGVNFFVIDKNGFYIYKNNTLFDIVKDAARADVIDPKAWEISKKAMEERRKIVVEEEYAGTTYLSIKTPLMKENDVIGVMGISIDITDRKRAEQAEIEKQILAEKLALTEAFAGFMAHELRTPVSSLNTDLDTIVGNEKIQDAVERQKKLFEIIAKGKQTVKGANTFIDMLLFKLRNMGKKIKKEDLNLCLILEDVSDALALYPLTETESRQVTFEKKDSFVYLGDGLHTQHIILNLLKNALKIIYEERKGHITISFEQNKDCNKLIFVDTAKGIAPEFLPTIFDAFVSKDETRKGTGLGLAYCKLIMQDYGGNITCESKLGEYTKFILTFPKVDMDEV